MSDTIQHANDTVTLLGGGPVEAEDLNRAIRLAPDVWAADGGANYARLAKIPVKHIVGDFDSLTKRQYWHDLGVKLTQLDEQDSTDFEKCLYSTDAAIAIGVGFLGARLDHTLACLRTLVARPAPQAVLLGNGEIVFRCPRNFELELSVGTRVSLFPMGPVSGLASSGLRWSIKGLAFDPAGQIGTSNVALGGPISVAFDADRMLMILPDAYLEAVVTGLRATAAVHDK